MHVLFHQHFFLHRQGQDDRRAHILGRKFFLSVILHGTFIQHFFMSCMLVDHIQLILKLHQPVCIKQLSQNFMIWYGAFIQKLLIRCLLQQIFQLHLFCFFYIRNASCFQRILLIYSCLFILTIRLIKFLLLFINLMFHLISGLISILIYRSDILNACYIFRRFPCF